MKPLYYRIGLSALLLSCVALMQSHTQSTQDILNRIEQEDIHYIDFVFSDLNGALKELMVPVSKVAHALEHGVYFDGSSVAGYSTIYESDMLAIPDLSTFCCVPWVSGMANTARIICDVYLNEDEPYQGDPRTILKTAMKEVRDQGYIFNVGPELEFFLCAKNGNNPCDNQNYFAATTDLELLAFKHDLLDALQAQNIPVEKLHHEVANGQYEISLKYADALTMADYLTLAKHTIKVIAELHDLSATFMPKPFAGKNGSGMHVHFSLYDIQAEKNVFYDTTNPSGLSLVAHHFIAGIINHISEFNALLNPSINSYKRLVPGYEAPIYICWGMKNRSAMIRIPQFQQGQASAARAEIRSPDALSNPYLLFSALLCMGINGIAHEQLLPAATEVNLYTLSAHQIAAAQIVTLPTSLEQALNALEQSAMARTLLGDRLHAEFIGLKRKEIKSFALNVTDWERSTYW